MKFSDLSDCKFRFGGSDWAVEPPSVSARTFGGASRIVAELGRPCEKVEFRRSRSLRSAQVAASVLQFGIEIK